MLTNLEKPQAILFDWDGTLVNSWVKISRALENTCNHLQLPVWSEEDINKLGHTMEEIFDGVFGEHSEHAKKIFVKHYNALDSYLDHSHIFDGVIDVLELVRAQNIYTAVVSNKIGHLLRDEVEVLGLNHYFSKVIGASDLPRNKPHADQALHVLEQANIKPGSHVWFVGDNVVDVECAHNAGITAILLGVDHEHLPRKPHLVISNHNELKQILNNFYLNI